MAAVDLSKRLKLLNITDITIGNMRTFHPIVQNNIDNLIAEFYRFIHHMPATAAIFYGYDIERHLKPAQKKHWDSLFSGRFDDDYIDQAIRIGTIHYRRKVAPYLYIAGYNYFHCEMIRLAALHYSGMDLAELLQAIAKAVALDMDLALTSYTRAAWLHDA
ncbi:MAG: protoglobin domain-containing protein [Magnetospirillum sp.]|nr:protoglobin domain-containing protein [Magnetospirillum sp.]